MVHSIQPNWRRTQEHSGLIRASTLDGSYFHRFIRHLLLVALQAGEEDGTSPYIWKQNIFCTWYTISSIQSRIQFRKRGVAILIVGIMVVVIVAVNRLVWRPLYRKVVRKYSMSS